MIKISNLSKSYRNCPIISNMEVAFNDSDIIVMVGNNGIGKTTLINLIMGYIKPTNGYIDYGCERSKSAEWISNNCLLIDEKIQHVTNGTLKSIIEIQESFNSGFNKELCLDITKTFKLDLNKKYNKLSKGMKNQFNIALGVAQDKPILIFDEPCAGLDEISRFNFNKIIAKDFESRPRLLIISTHMLDELQNIATKLLVLTDNGYLYKDIVEVDNMYIKLIAPRDILTPLLSARETYNRQELGLMSSAITTSELSHAEKKYIKENNVGVEQISLTEACRIVCNKSTFEVSHEKTL